MGRSFVSIAVVFSFALAAMPGFSQDIKGRVLEPSEHNLALTWRAAHVALPAGYAGEAPWQGRADQMPAIAQKDQPLAIFMHGSSGLAPFVKDYQLWLASNLGLASIAPDSLAIPERLTYTSPIAKDIYERVHSLRHGELGYALEQAKRFAWVDSKRIAVIGASEGAVAIARLSDPLPAARIIYGWSCEENYFVTAPQNAVPIDRPVLAMIATRDPYFSAENPWNAGYAITGSCAFALKGHKDATIVAIASDKHTIVALPAARDIAAAFLKRTLSL